jgi:ornithine carbamoyltransferase
VSELGRLRGADFLDLAELQPGEVRALLDLAARIKAGQWAEKPLDGKAVAIVLQKPSMRTRTSFHVGIERLGGRPITLQDSEIGIGTRETPEDVARVLERYTAGIVARLFSHDDLLAMAGASSRPVINALTDVSHPCQVLADVLTIGESLGCIDDRTKVAFVGDGNNVATSLMEASALLGFQLTVVSPPAYWPPKEAARRAPGVQLTSDVSAVEGADVVYTDVWTSMGQESEVEVRRHQFAEYQVNEALMEMAPGAVVMHCLPAHRGEEITAAVIDGPQSIVFDQAENRLWAQMALMAALFANGADGP